MFIRVNGVIINLDEICSACLASDPYGKKVLKIGMRQGQRINVYSFEADPELLFETMTDALAENGLLHVPPEPEPPIELSPLEAQALEAAAAQGYRFIARDFSGALFAYHDRPEKAGKEWSDTGSVRPQRMRNELFCFIDFDDEAAMSIAELLGY